MLKSWSETAYAVDSRAQVLKTASAHENSAASYRPAKFNVFQRLVRQWEGLHPYNGAQILKISGTVDLNLCREAWLGALDSLNLGVVCISDNAYGHRCLNGEATFHGVVLCPEGTEMDGWLSQELNHRFEPGGGVPFRPFVIQEKEYFWMGLVYQHWVADSASIRMLMHEWFVRQYDPGKASRRSVRFDAGGYLSLFGGNRRASPATEVLLSSLRWQCRFKKARRIEDREKFQDMSLRFAAFRAPDGLIDPLRNAARRVGGTVNDIFLGAIAQVCDECVPALRRLRRRELAIGSIVDLRPISDRPLSDVFDLLLGFTCVSCSAKDLGHWPGLMKSITRQTQEQKCGGLPLASCLRMAAGLVVGKYYSRERVIEFYRKRVPLAGANSNVNLNRCWAGKYARGQLLDYVRAAPTGPMTPVVFTTTTLGDSLSLGLTYRSGIISPRQAGTIGDKFIGRLREIADS